MAGTVANLIMGPAVVRIGAFGAAEPANASVAIVEADWPDVGFTDGGATLTIGQTYTPMMVDQVALAVGSRLTEQVFTVATTFAEATLANLRRSMNVADDPVATKYSLKSDIANVEPLYRAVMLEGRGPTNLPRRVIIRRGLSTENIEMAYTKDGKTVVPVTFSAYYVSSSIDPIVIDDTQAP